MNATDKRGSWRAALEVVAQAIWVFGASAAYFTGATLDPVAGLGVLAGTFALVLALAMLARGRGAVPRMLAALLLQAPLLVGLGVYALHRPLEDDPYPCFFFHGTALQQLEAFTAVAVLSAPLGALLRLEASGIARVRAAARRAAPIAAAAAMVLVALGAARLARLPTPDRYVDALPAIGTIPLPMGQPCTPVAETYDPKHAPEWERVRCATPEVELPGIAFHFHGDVRDGKPRWYDLYTRSREGRDRMAFLFVGRDDTDALVVRRDEAAKLFFVRHRGRLAFASPESRRWRVDLDELRDRLAPPLGFWWAAVIGLVAALGCLGAGAALGDAAPKDRARGEAWVAARRGDLSIAALAILLSTSALLVAALVCGFLP